ncbi:MAG: hypothetical protein JWM82_2487 [Myxococcales bacterium]|jgi:hypothetical protein|nr:hypothetical protein [Myxococcales bacterium]
MAIVTFNTDFGSRDRYAGAMKGVLARALGAALMLGAVLAGGCTVGNGSGTASGSLKVLGCDENDSLKDGQAYELRPTFFAGEPIEDICPARSKCPGAHTNRLLIRMQRTGNQVENNDTLYFDVQNALEVARCVRGRTANGAGDWDTRKVTNADGSSSNLPWCDWGAGAADAGAVDDAGVGTDDAAGDAATTPVVMTAERARINLSTEDYVRASFSPLHTCVAARLVGVALPGSWIEFADFGSAVQTSKTPDARDAVGTDFKVDFGERLHATFHLELGDQRVTNAQKVRDAVPSSRISGILDGSFDFDLQRGRAAQPFP